MSKRILILANQRKEGVCEQVENLLGWFRRRAEVVAVLPANEPVTKQAEGVDLCVVFGGDGTFLSAARMTAGTGMPLLGVNMGKLGFLADFNVEHLQRHLDDILAGKVPPVERMMLQVRIVGCKKHGFTSPAANDVAICAGRPFRMIDLSVAHRDHAIASYLGDGLIVSTPSGSTAYSLSVGGPILEPALDAVAITPIAPHTLSLRPIVVSSDRPVIITANRVNEGTSVIVDGQVSSGLCDNDTIEVTRLPTGLRIVPHPGRNFYDTLRTKLNWAQSPHHTQ